MPKHWNEDEVYSREAGFDMMIAYDGSNREQYVGIAIPGSLTSASAWSIYKLEYDGTSGGVAKKRFADGTDEFSKIWDSKTSYTYRDIA